MSNTTEGCGDMQAELERVAAERDAALRVSEVAMRLLDEHKLLPELRHRLDEAERPDAQ